MTKRLWASDVDGGERWTLVAATAILTAVAALGGSSDPCMAFPSFTLGRATAAMASAGAVASGSSAGGTLASSAAASGSSAGGTLASSAAASGSSAGGTLALSAEAASAAAAGDSASGAAGSSTAGCGGAVYSGGGTLASSAAAASVTASTSFASGTATSSTAGSGGAAAGNSASSTLASAPASGTSGSAKAVSRPGAAWLPAGSQLVVRLRYSEMKTSALMRRLMQSRPLFGEELDHIDRFVSRASLDPARDLDVGLIATDGNERGESVAVLSGAYDARTLGARLERSGASVVRYGDVVLYRIGLARAPSRTGAGSGGPAPRSRSGAPPLGGSRSATERALSSPPKHAPLPGPGTVVAFADRVTALVGTEAWVRLALDRAAGRGQAAAGTSAMGALLGRVDEGATVWAAAANRAVARKIQSESRSGGLGSEDLEGIENMIASFRITDEVRVESEAATASEEDANVLVMLVRSLAVLGGLQASATDPSLADVLRSLRVDRVGKGVRLTARVPGAVALRL